MILDSSRGGNLTRVNASPALRATGHVCRQAEAGVEGRVAASRRLSVREPSGDTVGSSGRKPSGAEALGPLFVSIKGLWG